MRVSILYTTWLAWALTVSAAPIKPVDGDLSGHIAPPPKNPIGTPINGPLVKIEAKDSFNNNKAENLNIETENDGLSKRDETTSSGTTDDILDKVNVNAATSDANVKPISKPVDGVVPDPENAIPEAKPEIDPLGDPSGKDHLNVVDPGKLGIENAKDLKVDSNAIDDPLKDLPGAPAGPPELEKAAKTGDSPPETIDPEAIVKKLGENAPSGSTDSVVPKVDLNEVTSGVKGPGATPDLDKDVPSGPSTEGGVTNAKTNIQDAEGGAIPDVKEIVPEAKKVVPGADGATPNVDGTIPKLDTRVVQNIRRDDPGSDANIPVSDVEATAPPAVKDTPNQVGDITRGDKITQGTNLFGDNQIIKQNPGETVITPKDGNKFKDFSFTGVSCKNINEFIKSVDTKKCEAGNAVLEITQIQDGKAVSKAILKPNKDGFLVVDSIKYIKSVDATGAEPLAGTTVDPGSILKVSDADKLVIVVKDLKKQAEEQT